MTVPHLDDQQLNDFLQFHSELEPDDFTAQVVSKAVSNSKLRRNIFALFTLLGMILSALLFVYFVPSNSLTGIITQLPVYTVALLVFCLMSSSLWLLSNQES